MQHAPYYLYLWLAYHLVFILAFVVRGQRWPATDDLYYPARKLFMILGAVVVLYVVSIKWIAGWRIDNWWAEALPVFFTFCLGHIVFIIGPRGGVKDIYSRYRRQYVGVAAGYIVLFYARLLLAVLSGFSYNVHASASFLPDVRTNDLHLFRNYYLSSSERKGIVLEKKMFIFSKDIGDRHRLAGSMCSFHNYDLAGDGSADPFPYVARSDSEVQLQLTPAHRRMGYVSFRMAGDSLEVTGYRAVFDTAATTLQYEQCGVYRAK
ncbi:MAG: hypothetical protein JWQ38_2600 [Flavipsychrobacter sp.]|nr:hypothetical protein [Flavipsychrobacter sp.]